MLIEDGAVRVKLAKTAGFCMGVRRAMRIVLDATHRSTGPVYTVGPLIHNPQVLELLEKKNVRECDEETDLSGETVVIRAHGIPPDDRRRLQGRGAFIRDATCPHVLHLQAIIRRHVSSGYQCVIVGDRGHAEVTGLLGFAGDKGHVVEKVEDVDLLPAMEKVCVVAQTTQDRQLYEQVTGAIKERFENCTVFDTICDSTGNRQKEALDLATQVDAMVVVGGKNSANTRRLVEICRGTEKATFHVESAGELDENVMKKFKAVGVTAGASTPHWLIVEVIAKLRALDRSPVATKIHMILGLAIRSNLYIGVAAGFLCYACCVMLRIPARWAYFLIAGLYVFAMHTANRLTDKYADQTAAGYAADLYTRSRKPLLMAAVAAIVLTLVLSWLLHVGLFFLLMLACAAGGLYRLRIIPSFLARLTRYKSLVEIPGSKEVFLSGAWAMACVLVPVLSSGTGLSAGVIVVFFFAFGLVFMRAVLLDIRDIQRDEIVGRETIPVLLEKENTKRLLGGLGLVMIAMMFAATYAGWVSPVGYLMTLCVAYAAAYLILYHFRIIAYGIGCEAVVDGSFIVAGLLALIHKAASHGGLG